MPERNSWLIYAAGSGWGHLTRAIALAKLASKNRAIKIVSSSPFAKNVLSSAAWTDLNSERKISLLYAHQSNEAFASLVQEALALQDFSCLLVDTFPRGIIGELDETLRTKKNYQSVLIHRDISPEYVSQFGLREYVRQNFDLLINPGEALRPVLSELALMTSAWLIRDQDELRQQSSLNPTATSCLLSKKSSALVIIIISGNEEEQAIFCRIAQTIRREFPQVELRCLAPSKLSDEELENLRVEYWPGMDILSQADLVIGAAGYNTINECAALQIPLIACPLKRKYDRQLERSLDSSAITASSLEQVVHHTRIILEEKPSRAKSEAPHFKNGAREALELIENMLQLHSGPR